MGLHLVIRVGAGMGSGDGTALGTTVGVEIGVGVGAAVGLVDDSANGFVVTDGVVAVVGRGDCKTMRFRGDKQKVALWDLWLQYGCEVWRWRKWCDKGIAGERVGLGIGEVRDLKLH